VGYLRVCAVGLSYWSRSESSSSESMSGGSASASKVGVFLGATQTAEDKHQQLFFRATGLGLGQHTLVITNELENDVLTLD